VAPPNSTANRSSEIEPRHHGARPNECDPGQQAGPTDRLSRRAFAPAAAQAGHQQHSAHEQDERESISRHEADHYERTPDGRAGDGGHLHERRVVGDGARKGAQRRDVRQQCLAGRLIECPCDAEHHHNSEDRRGVAHFGDDKRQEAGGAHGQQQVGEQLQPAAVVSVRGVSRREDQDDERQELREPDEAQVEGIARRAEYLPAHRHRLDLRGE
jgi:hypothetical protein